MASGFRADMDFRVGGLSFRSFRLWLRVRDVAGVRVCFVPQVRSGFSVSGFGMFKVLGVSFLPQVLCARLRITAYHGM